MKFAGITKIECTKEFIKYRRSFKTQKRSQAQKIYSEVQKIPKVQKHF